MVYLAIHYVAQDSFVFQMDDFLVQGNILSIEDNLFNKLSHYVANNQLVIDTGTSLENIQLYNLLGQQVLTKKLSNTNETINIESLDRGCVSC